MGKMMHKYLKSIKKGKIRHSWLLCNDGNANKQQNQRELEQ